MGHSTLLSHIFGFELVMKKFEVLIDVLVLYFRIPSYLLYFLEVILNIVVDIRPIKQFFDQWDYRAKYRKGERVDRTYMDFEEMVIAAGLTVESH